MGWMQSTRAVFCDPASVAPAAGAVDPRPCPSSWKQGFSHGHRATAALRLFLDKQSPLFVKYAAWNEPVAAQKHSAAWNVFTRISLITATIIFFMLALPPTAPSLLLF